MNDFSELLMRVKKLETQHRLLKGYALAVTALPLLALLWWIATPTPALAAQVDNQVLRARGLVIVDEVGRERILIGAPIPEAKNRVRTDQKRIRELWASRFPEPDQYMDIYKKLNHSTNGIVILNEQGFDRLALGESVTDPISGQRIAPAMGLVLNDDQGAERSGYAILKVNGKNRVNLGMDHAEGREGVVMFVVDNGPSGVMAMNQKERAFLGTAPANDPFLRLKAPFFGMLVKVAEDLRFSTTPAPAK